MFGMALAVEKLTRSRPTTLSHRPVERFDKAFGRQRTTARSRPAHVLTSRSDVRQVQLPVHRRHVVPDLFNYDFRRTERCIIPCVQRGQTLLAPGAGIGWRNIIEKMHLTATLTKWCEHGRHEIFAGGKRQHGPEHTLVLDAEAVARASATSTRRASRRPRTKRSCAPVRPRASTRRWRTSTVKWCSRTADAHDSRARRQEGKTRPDRPHTNRPSRTLAGPRFSSGVAQPLAGWSNPPGFSFPSDNLTRLPDDAIVV